MSYKVNYISLHRIVDIFFKVASNGSVKYTNVLMIIFLIKMRNLCLKWHSFLRPVTVSVTIIS